MSDDAVAGVLANLRAENARILHERAVALARRPAMAEEAWVLTDVVEFALAQECYALESEFVREVQPLKGLTPVPCTPPLILGIVNIRGQILTVMDLKKLFELPEKGIGDFDKLIILRCGLVEVGILADAILGVRSIALGTLRPVPPTLTGWRADCLKGIGSNGAILLDVEKLLSDRRIVVNEDVR